MRPVEERGREVLAEETTTALVKVLWKCRRSLRCVWVHKPTRRSTQLGDCHLLLQELCLDDCRFQRSPEAEQGPVTKQNFVQIYMVSRGWALRTIVIPGIKMYHHQQLVAVREERGPFRAEEVIKYKYFVTTLKWIFQRM
ncbi:unnamed protein product [Pleuronectes platessa]|uniref:Uncharacterized protein n=1 Tax=Pleuronectes platessa TaxID=8262 RepID=A0A9N7VB30_PLEPL|nr:unnamed protein product [Pleuronectes platessa]